ncbi:hypothetical protein [Streptomyces chartreusis]|uniref:hypothetical protein n=1 Tax=Streptomyces chartreusis TaxID=1969 RepID=UPI00363686E9
MTRPSFTTRELELLDEALGALSEVAGEALSDETETELEALSFKIRHLGPKPTCPGWGEECGNETEGSDLCPDCHMARLDAQSPRIPL